MRDIPHSPLTYSLYAMPLTDAAFDAVVTDDRKATLRTNRYLTAHQWDVLWTKRLPAQVSRMLADFPLGADQLDRLLREEKRGSVLMRQFDYPQLSSDQQRQILESADGTDYVHCVASSRYFDRTHLQLAATKFRGIARLDWICANDVSVVDDDAAVDALCYFETENGRRYLRDIGRFTEAVNRLVHQRPQLVERLMTLETVPSSLLVPLAGSRHLTDRAHQERMLHLVNESFFYPRAAFAANPVVHADLAAQVVGDDFGTDRNVYQRRIAKHGEAHIAVSYDSVEDLNQIEWLLQRSTPRDRYHLPRSYDLVVLARNPNLRRPHAMRVHRILAGASTSTCPAAAMNEAMRLLEERFSLPKGPEHVDNWFWEPRAPGTDTTPFHADASYRGTAPFETGPALAERWLLDPNRRPWSDDDVVLAYERINPTELEALRTGPYLPFMVGIEHLHAYLVRHLGEDQQAWSTLFDLAETHIGSVASLAVAAKKLRRR